MCECTHRDTHTHSQIRFPVLTPAPHSQKFMFWTSTASCFQIYLHYVPFIIQSLKKWLIECLQCIGMCFSFQKFKHTPPPTPGLPLPTWAHDEIRRSNALVADTIKVHWISWVYFSGENICKPPLRAAGPHWRVPARYWHDENIMAAILRMD